MKDQGKHDARFIREGDHENGGQIILPKLGTITVENGMITVWRDYFDPADFDRQRAAITG